MDHNIGLILQKRAFLTPDLDAIYEVNSGTRLTYAQLNLRVDKVANAFLSLGISKGDRVGMLLKNGIEFVETLFALAKIGAIAVPLNWRLLADELEYILNDSGISLLVFDTDFSTEVKKLQTGNHLQIKNWLHVSAQEETSKPETSAEKGADFESQDFHTQVAAASSSRPEISAQDDDDLFIMYTSGTTGSPKGVVHTHHTTMWATITNSATNPPRLGDRFLNILPLFHIGALNPMITCIKSGVCLVMPRVFNPQQVWQLIDKEKINTMLAVPAMLNAMLQVYPAGEIDHSELRYCIVGAAPVPESMIKTYHTMGICLRQAYALTESCGSACIVDENETQKRIGSTGKAYFHTDVKIVNANGEDASTNETGEIVIKAPHMMKGYWNNPEATAKALRNGWLYTGDVGTMDEEGFITIKDRLSDMIISGGENVYPAEVENALSTHPDILEAAIIGRPHKKWGESPLAVVACKESGKQLQEQDIIDYCKTLLASYKCPRDVVLVESLPRNSGGKILKRVLRERYVLNKVFKDSPEPELSE